MRPLALALVLTLGLFVAGEASAKAPKCTDPTSHKSIKCPVASTTSATNAAPKTKSLTAAKPTQTAKCKGAKGLFTKCASSGTAPVAATPVKPAPAPMTPKPAITSASPAQTATAAAPAVSAPAAKFASAPSAAPAGATALCKDGSYSMSKHHSGSCSHHGGVANFL